MTLNPPAERPPAPDYEGRNGFIDPTALRMKGQQDRASSSNSGVDIQQRELRDMVEKRLAAEDALELRGSYCPGLEAMQAFIEHHETASDVRERLSLLQRRHRDVNHALIDRLAQDYHNETLEEYHAKDDAIDFEEIDNFYTSLQLNRPQVYAALSTLENYQYADMSTFVPLVEHCSKLKADEDAARRKRDAVFPTNVSEFRAIRTREIQLRIARFLTSDKITQERMMSEFGWAYRQVTPLQNEYRIDADFNDEIHDLLREFGSYDPRRRTSNSSAV